MIHDLPCVAAGYDNSRAAAYEAGSSQSAEMRRARAEEAATALQAGTSDFPKRSKRLICRRENVSIAWGHLLARLRTTQFLEQENKRFIRSPGRVPKAHLTGSIRRNVGLGRVSIQNGFDLAGRRDDEFGM
jgi:hypothetical protein